MGRRRGGRAPLADWAYGVEITKLCQAAYMSAETGRTINLEDPAIQQALESYQSPIALGRGREMLHVRD